ncbi:sigma-54 interaction domain-containing protein [Alkalihalophilus sp. As8PL]|uniref:HTH-type transcriptional regulatory protein TyrR n=1 Tax=Alkalihalophilus sp. As8PL TaxID=3237103 RepID=A0AB39BPU5_9BACI
MLKMSDSIEEAIAIFSSEGNEYLEVQDDDGEVIGLLTLSALNEAIQQKGIDHSIERLIDRKDLIELQPLPKTIVENDYSKLLQSHVFEEIIHSLYDGVYITNQDGVTVAVNRAYERITGIKAEEVIGYHMEYLEKAGFISKSVSIEVLKEKRPITRMQTIKNERKIIVSGTPIFAEDQQVLYVINSVRDITELLRLKHEIEELQQIKSLRQSAKDMNSDMYDEILHSSIISEETFEIYELAERIAKTDVKVLIQGETGVGKTLIAKFIHEKSNRVKQPFFELNCGALPAALIEAELFGYVAGAFTGASAKGKKGLMELAHEGTLFLDEIGDLPLELQVKLLKVVEENKFIPVGSTEVKHVDVRVIAASHKNLKEMVAQGTFREDLFYRLSVVPLTISSLRHRRKEIIPLIDYYLEKCNEKYGYDKQFSLEALDTLSEYRWPGNIRELINVVERLVVTTKDPVIDVQHIPEECRISYKDHMDTEEILPLKTAISTLERELIMRALKKYKTTRKAAEVLQVSQSTIVQKMKKWERDE